MVAYRTGSAPDSDRRSSACEARFIGKRERALATKTFTLERPTGFDYEPGQFFFVWIPADDAGSAFLQHHFTLSSSPTEENLEFTTRLTGHPFKERMDELAPGAVLRVDGPEGSFALQPGMKKVCYVCGGIGITPARSTVRWALDTGADVDITVLYANRDLESIAFREEFEAIGSHHIRVLDVLSDADAGWSGRRGRIDADLVRAEVPDFAGRHFFVSGPPGMVAALAGMLALDVGIPKDRLMTEDFTGYE